MNLFRCNNLISFYLFI